MKIFDVVAMGKSSALESYTEVPKTVTAIRHADESDDSEFHCVWTGTIHDVVDGKQLPDGRLYCIKKVFTVPKQTIEICVDAKYGKFYVILVIPQFEVPLHNEKEFYLVAQMSGQSGFLIPVNEFLREIKEMQPAKLAA